MLNMINKKQLKKLNDNKLLKLTKKIYRLVEDDQISEVALHYFINEVSARHYGYEDVMNSDEYWLEYLCFTNDGNELVKMVKIDSAKKFIKNGEVGDCILPVTNIRSIDNDDKGNLLFFA